MDAALEREVWRRAKGLCEYCRLPQACTRLPFQIDHIIAEQHGGLTTLDNLALACLRCNKRKGPNIAGINPDTGEIIRLYHPRRDRWLEHFAWNRSQLIGLTAIGMATITVLGINHPSAIAVRAELLAEGLFPP
jgi:5-methylcytosine-specific restriction endonuclease McrA